MTTIVGVRVYDVRFPTSRSQDGSDAMNKDGDYSAAYVVLDTDDPTLAGYGFTFTIGRGNDLAVEAARQRAQPLIGRDVDELVVISGRCTESWRLTRSSGGWARRRVSSIWRWQPS